MSVYQKLIKGIPIEKGWSGDRKFCAITNDGQKYLLRISSIDRLERKRREYENMRKVAQLDIPMCLPMVFGTCLEGAYSIQSWIDGTDAECAIISMSTEDQYRYGWAAGQILAKIHTIPAPDDASDWATRFYTKIDRKITMYENCELKYEQGGEAFLSYIAQNRYLLTGRPQSYQHGDYHIGNMMIDRNGTLTVIDFDRDDYGDPWEEFNRIVWCAQVLRWYDEMRSVIPGWTGFNNGIITRKIQIIFQFAGNTFCTGNLWDVKIKIPITRRQYYAICRFLWT